MKRRWVIVAIASMALIGASIVVRTERKNRQLAKLAAAYRMAVRWYRKSAEQGNANGEYSLAHMYHEGQGLPRDLERPARERCPVRQPRR